MFSRQQALFPEGAAPLPEWLPDETLYSLVSRTHVLFGGSSSARTSKLLFGQARGGTQHDIPSHLLHLEAATNGAWGTAGDLARNKTLIRFYRPFLTRDAEAALVRRMCHGSVAHLKFNLGLLTSSFRAHHPLKACLACLAADRLTFGWTYWHLEHQMPGVWVCEKHFAPLLEATVKSTGVQRFAWVLPGEGILRPPVIEHCPIQATNQKLASFARLVAKVVSRGGCTKFDRLATHRACRGRLETLGLEKNGRLLWRPLIASFRQYLEQVRGIPELSALPNSDDGVRAQLTRLLRAPRSGAHPLWHLLLINWLFDDLDDFVRVSLCLASQERSERERRGAEDGERGTDPRFDTLVMRLRVHGESIRSAASVVGIDTSTAMAWAAAAGIAPRRRSKILKPDVREQLVVMLRTGVDKAEAAKAFAISIQTITRTLLTTPGLHQQWRDARYLTLQRRHRRMWRLLSKRYPGAGAKLLRCHASAAYAWLYRHDRIWLTANQPVPSERKPSFLPEAVWLARDEALSHALQRAVSELACRGDLSRLFLWRLYQAVPNLRPMLRRLEKLPLTRKVIERALAWRRSAKDELGLFK